MFTQFEPASPYTLQRCWFNCIDPVAGMSRYVTIAYVQDSGYARCSRTGVWRAPGAWELHEVALEPAEKSQTQLGLF